MKKIIKVTFVFFVTSVSLVYFVWAKYYAAEFMSLEQAKKTWGIKKFDKKVFREGDSTKRASMAVSILKEKMYVGKDMLLSLIHI